MAPKPNRQQKGPRMINEILRLHRMGLGTEKIAAALSLSRNTVRRYIRQQSLADMEGTLGPVAAALGPPHSPAYHAPWSSLVAWEAVKSATSRGVQLRHFWEEHVATGERPALRGVPYVSFWREFKRRFPVVALDMHREFPPAERCEADYKGVDAGVGYTDVHSGSFIQCHLFGNILAFSQLLYVEATHSEKQLDFLSAFARSFTYFGGVPATAMVDNAKVGVSKAARYDPDFQPEFTYFCEHFSTAHLAAQVKSPKHKCFIENALGVFWRWAGPKVRQRQFFSLASLNVFLRDLLDAFNSRIQRKYGESRRQKFEAGERSKLSPLPSAHFQVASWKVATAHPDCHVQVGFNFYSVPYQLRGKELGVRVTPHFAEVFFNMERVALHVLFSGSQRGRYQTKREHLPESHLAVKEFTPRRALQDAKSIGPATLGVVENLFAVSSHPLLHLRRIQGILRLGQRYCAAKLEAACQKILTLGIQSPRLADIEAIVKGGTDTPGAPPDVVRGVNPNLRGQRSFE